MNPSPPPSEHQQQQLVNFVWPKKKQRWYQWLIDFHIIIYYNCHGKYWCFSVIFKNREILVCVKLVWRKNSTCLHIAAKTILDLRRRREKCSIIVWSLCGARISGYRAIRVLIWQKTSRKNEFQVIWGIRKAVNHTLDVIRTPILRFFFRTLRTSDGRQNKRCHHNVHCGTRRIQAISIT